MKYTIELKNKREKDNLISLLNHGLTTMVNLPYKDTKKYYDVFNNVIAQLNEKTEGVTIEEMKKTCNIVWGWQADGWDDKKIKEMYTLYKQGYFNLK